MRNSKLSIQEIAELDETKRKETRKSGFSLMTIRDRGWSVIKNYLGNDVRIVWNTTREPWPGEAIDNIPNGMIRIDVPKGTKSILVDVEDLNKWTRWA